MIKIMRKILINKRIGGYSLSNDAIREYLKTKNIKFVEKQDEIFETETIFMSEDDPDNCLSYHVIYEVARDDPILIEVVEKLGIEESSGSHCRLKIIEIPDDVEWYLGQGEQGTEWVYEKHRIWE